MKEPYLRVDHLTKNFPVLDASASKGAKEFCVFRQVDFEIERGEFMTMIGHSGCGKSTLLNIIAGFEEPTGGGVILEGREVAKPGIDRMVVFQSFALMPWLSAFNNVRVAVHAANPGMSRERIRQRTQKYIDLMGLTGSERKVPALLSGGMRQRVGLARAFSVEPKILLLDEPFAQIDALTRGVIQEELMRMWSATKSTVFMVTHDVDEAILLSDRIALMTNGPQARLHKIFDVPIPRPRRREELIDMPEYTRIRSQVLHFLMEHAHSSSDSNRALSGQEDTDETPEEDEDENSNIITLRPPGKISSA
jgi:nitrate/nitrite transport system ATP-binding protein